MQLIRTVRNIAPPIAPATAARIGKWRGPFVWVVRLAAPSIV